MKRLIVNADDFGQDEDTLTRTIEGFELGKITSATIMAGMPMNIEIDGVQFQYATRFIQSKKDPTYTIADDGTLEANETTFSPSCFNGAYETSVILHRTLAFARLCEKCGLTRT